MHALQLRPCSICAMSAFLCVPVLRTQSTLWLHWLWCTQGWKRKWDSSTPAEIITIGNKNITVYSMPTLGNAQLREARRGAERQTMGKKFVLEEVEEDKDEMRGLHFPTTWTMCMSTCKRSKTSCFLVRQLCICWLIWPSHWLCGIWERNEHSSRVSAYSQFTCIHTLFSKEKWNIFCCFTFLLLTVFFPLSSQIIYLLQFTLDNCLRVDMAVERSHSISWQKKKLIALYTT